MTQEDIRRLALALPEAIEADHHGARSFRVAGKIFCIVSQDLPRLTVKLGFEDQRNLADAHPGAIEPVPGYWGRKGSTFVDYDRVEPALIEMLVRMSWSSVAPAKLKARRL